jgi:hypothetical protein
VIRSLNWRPRRDSMAATYTLCAVQPVRSGTFSPNSNHVSKSDREIRYIQASRAAILFFLILMRRNRSLVQSPLSNPSLSTRRRFQVSGERDFASDESSTFFREYSVLSAAGGIWPTTNPRPRTNTGLLPTDFLNLVIPGSTCQIVCRLHYSTRQCQPPVI